MQATNGRFAVVCLVHWPYMEPKLEAELTLFSDKPSCFSRANRVKDKKTKTERFVTKKVNCSLAFIQRLGHSAHNL